MKFSQIKKTAKNTLSGNIRKILIYILFSIILTAVFTFIPIIVSSFVSAEIIVASVTGGSLLLYWIFRCAVRSGTVAWFSFYKRKNRLERALYWLRPGQASGSVRLRLSLLFRKAGWSFLLVFPGIFTVFSFCLLAFDSGLEFNLFLCGIIGGAVMLLLGLIMRFIIVQRYFLSEYIFIQSPDIKIKKAISLSKEKMNGRLKKTALFKLSFLPMMLLCIGIFPSFYVWPYYRQSCAVLAGELKKT